MSDKNDLEDVTDELLLKRFPGIRAAIRDALDNGVSPEELRRRYWFGKAVKLLAHCAIDAAVAEWEREVDQLAIDLQKKSPPQ